MEKSGATGKMLSEQSVYIFNLWLHQLDSLPPLLCGDLRNNVYSVWEVARDIDRNIDKFKLDREMVKFNKRSCKMVQGLGWVGLMSS